MLQRSILKFVRQLFQAGTICIQHLHFFTLLIYDCSKPTFIAGFWVPINLTVPFHRARHRIFELDFVASLSWNLNAVKSNGSS